MIASPCFLVGSERSGTTLTRLMLKHHPQIAWSGEFEYVVDLLPESAGDGWPDLAKYHEYLRLNRIFGGHQLQVDPHLSYPELVDDFLRQVQRKQGDKPIVGATVHHHFERLTRIWPDARFIHIIRDGRDVGRSYISKGWAGNMWTAGAGWLKAERTWDAMRRELTAERYVELRYEDLLRDPERELRRLCEFLGIAYDPAMLDYAQSTETFEKPDPKMIGQWRKKLKPDEVRLSEARIGAMLQARGYELSGHPALEVTPQMERRLRRQDRWARMRFRMKRHGPWLFMQDFVARRIGGPKSWRDSIQLKINQNIMASVRR